MCWVFSLSGYVKVLCAVVGSSLFGYAFPLPCLKLFSFLMSVVHVSPVPSCTPWGLHFNSCPSVFSCLAVVVHRFAGGLLPLRLLIMGPPLLFPSGYFAPSALLGPFAPDSDLTFSAFRLHWHYLLCPALLCRGCAGLAFKLLALCPTTFLTWCGVLSPLFLTVSVGAKFSKRWISIYTLHPLLPLRFQRLVLFPGFAHDYLALGVRGFVAFLVSSVFGAGLTRLRFSALRIPAGHLCVPCVTNATLASVLHALGVCCLLRAVPLLLCSTAPPARLFYGRGVFLGPFLSSFLDLFEKITL